MAILIAVLAFLCPVGIYCFFLASINQRSRPLMISGRWDAVGLLFATSGFVLITVPTLLAELYTRLAGVVFSVFVFDPWTILWVAYYFALLMGGWLMTRWRAPMTIIYNVDTAMFGKVLDAALATLGLAAIRETDRLILARAQKSEPWQTTGITELPPPAAPMPVGTERLGVLQVDTFPAMCHVTLRWEKCRADLRRDIERELETALAIAAPDESPAAGWFLTVSGLIFGALTMAVMAFAIRILLARH